MQLSTRSVALAAAIMWGGSVLLIGLGSMLSPGYGTGMLDLVATIYPGYHNSGGFVDLLMGTLYALLDGLVGGFVFAWLYNRLAKAE